MSYQFILMRAIHIQRYGRLPILTNCPRPIRHQGQLLIKMKYAPINPSDLFFYLGLYGIKKEGFPIMGFQGSGVIKQSDNESLKGRRVSVFANKSNGTYAQYIVSHPNETIIWPQDAQISLQQMSMCSVNPLSVLGMVDVVKQAQVQTVVLSAAASNTSKMLMRFLTQKSKIKTVLGLSRSAQHDLELKAAGYKQLYRMENVDGLKNELKNHGKTVFLDCVGGNVAGQIFNVLPPNSVMVNYGRLSKQNLGSIDLGQLYYRNKTIRGFWLNNYLQSVEPAKIQELKQTLISNCQLFRQKIRQIYPLQQFETATRESIKNQSEGKILLKIYN